MMDGQTELKRTGENGSQPVESVQGSTPMEVLAGGIAALSVGSSVAAMVLNPVTVVLVAGAFSSIIGPYAFYQQRKLTDVNLLMDTHNALRANVERMSMENRRLQETVTELSATIDRMVDVENALDVITSGQTCNVETFSKQVEENKRLFAEMQSHLRTVVLHNILSVVLSSDDDGNNVIDDNEIEDLLKKIQTINGVEVCEDRFRNALKKSDGSLQSVMCVLQDLMADDNVDLPEEHKIFFINEVVGC